MLFVQVLIQLVLQPMLMALQPTLLILQAIVFNLQWGAPISKKNYFALKQNGCKTPRADRLLPGWPLHYAIRQEPDHPEPSPSPNCDQSIKQKEVRILPLYSKASNFTPPDLKISTEEFLLKGPMDLRENAAPGLGGAREDDQSEPMDPDMTQAFSKLCESVSQKGEVLSEHLCQSYFENVCSNNGSSMAVEVSGTIRMFREFQKTYRQDHLYTIILYT